MKECCRCHESKPLDQFKRSRNRPDGLHPECKACCKASYRAKADHYRAYAREYYQQNPEPYRERATKQRQTPEHQEKARRLAEARAGRLPENPTPGELRARDWYLRYRAANAEKYRHANRRFVEKDRDQSNAYHRAYQARQRLTHPEKSTAHRHTRKARKLGNGGTFTAMQWRMVKARYNYTCLRCGKREPEIKLSPDHVVPLAMGGANSIDNIQPLCVSCNCRKHAKHIDYRPAFSA